MFHLN